ncbi:MAG TPA: hypothetical protein VGF06_18600 [Terriglobales bacterium]|jgi:hypothetical protein
MTSWADGPLLAGPVRAYRDHPAKKIVIETTKDNPAGAGLEICRLDFDRVDEARAIVAIPELLRGALPFADLGELVDGEWDDPLIIAPQVRLEITVGDIQRIAEARARAFPPVEVVQPRPRVRRGSGRTYRPKVGR